MSSKASIAFKILFLLFLIYFFLTGIQLMSAGFKLLGKGFAEVLLQTTNNQIVGLFIGILVTSIIQSSSCSTAITVGLVAGGSITLHNAIPIIMGANIGTTITNLLVSLAHIRRKTEFKQAFAGSVMHDIFNILTTIILFPLQMKFSLLEKLAEGLTSVFIGMGGVHIMDPLKLISEPVLKLFISLCRSHPIPIILLGLGFLFIALNFLAKLMRDLVATKAERYINEAIFQHPGRSFLAGFVLTSIIQSSSVTTSLVVPLIGTGILSLEAVFPYFLGANIGTTLDTVLAGLATGNPTALTVSFSFLLFNCIGACIFYPLRKIPISIAKWLGNMTTKTRIAAFIYILLVFFIIPLILIWRTR